MKYLVWVNTFTWNQWNVAADLNRAKISPPIVFRMKFTSYGLLNSKSDAAVQKNHIFFLFSKPNVNTRC